jgi:hypothetical protein
MVAGIILANQRWGILDQSAMRKNGPISDERSISLKKEAGLESIFKIKKISIFKKVFWKDPIF